MRTVFSFDQLCLRQKPQRLLASLVRTKRHYSLPPRWLTLPKPPRTLKGRRITVLSILTPAAFVALSEKDNDDGKTPEDHMLEASRAEIAKELPDNIRGVKRAWKGVSLLIDQYIAEPIATTFRFLHLFIIFVPVIATIPILFLGSRQKDRDNERSGTLWWYYFLVRSMERGGPAFIKV